MQAGGMSIVGVPSGSDGASTSSLQAVSMTTTTSKGVVSATLVRGAALTSSATQIVPLASRGGGGGVPTSAFVVAASSAPVVVASTSGFQGAVNPSRQRFYVELKEGETNVVSWKKLVKDAQKNALTVASDAPAGANPALEARIAPERAGLAPTNVAAPPEPLPAPTNRFSSVIEKIERLYKGVDSEEEDGGYASGDESYYDSDDGFIDDTELDEYFSVDTAKTKHTGFFVNRGKLEKVEESPPQPLPPQPLPVHVQRKRKRNITKLSSEIVAGEFAKKRVNIGLRLKDAARKIPVPVTPVIDASPSSLVKSSEKAITPKPLKRVQPILDERESNAEHTSRLSSDHSFRESFRESGKVEEEKDSPNQIQKMLVQLSDDEEDVVRFSRPKSGGKDRGVSDALLPSNRVAISVTESTRAERNNASKPVDESIEEQLATDDSRETEGFAALPKIRKSQQVPRDDEMKEPEGSGRALSTSVTSSPGNKEVSPKKVAGWPKGTVLERAINDLEKGVIEAFPLTGDRQEAIEKAESAGKSKRLPREVKQKLAKVARLAAKKGKIPDEFIERLMNIIGHVMRLKTLKRNLKSMVEMGLNAKQAKDVRLQDMKREVTELVKSKVATFRALDAELEGSSDDVQAASGSIEGSHSGRFKWDEATEDRICDLYDHYVEGMDEHKGPQIRKLYIELADLWPEGWMDNHGIKNAVTRAKERRKRINKLKMNEERRRKKAALVWEKMKADKEAAEMEKKAPSPPPPPAAVVPVSNKGVSVKEKLTIKSSKQRVEDTGKYTEERSKHSGAGISMEEARRMAVEIVSRHGVEYARKVKLAEQAAAREHGSAGSKFVSKPKSILKMEDSSKGKRTDDGSKVQRKLPRKSFEGKIVEHLARKRPRSESLESDSVETLRSSKSSLNGPVMKCKKVMVRPAYANADSDPKQYPSERPYPTSRVGPPTVKVSSSSDRHGNGAHSSHSLDRV